MPPLCKVCTSPHRSSIEYFILSREKSHPQIAAQYGLLKDSVGRHARNHMAKRGEALAVATEAGQTLSPASSRAATEIASTQRALLDRAEALIENAEAFYQKFKDSNNARDIKACLDANVTAIRLLGDLSGAFPKAASTNIDARSLTLNGLSSEDLRTLIAGIKAFQSANTFDSEARP